MAVTSFPQGLIRTSVAPQLVLIANDAVSGSRLEVNCARRNVTTTQNCGKIIVVNSRNGTPSGMGCSSAGLRILPLPTGPMSKSTRTWQEVVRSLDQLGNHKGGALSAEMNIFSRLGRILRSFVESFLGSQEDPEKIIDQAVVDMTTDLVKLRQTTAVLMASKKRAEIKYNDEIEAGKAWYRRAVKALEQGDEGLAKEALRRNKSSEENQKAFKSQLDQQVAVFDKVMASSGTLERKISEARSKKDLLKARVQTAKTSNYVNEILGSMESGSSLAAYRQMEEKVARLEAEADAISQVASDDLSTKFAKLEAAVDVDNDLQALKRTMLARPNSLPRGELPTWEMDYERSSRGY